jgi:CheY-like chemotaxis protein
MKTLLALAEHPDFAEAIRAGVNPDQYRVIARTNLEEAEPLLVHGLAEACIVDVELTSVREIWFLEKLRRKAPRCPVILYVGARQLEWEEEAYLQGATHVLTKPVRGRMLTALLDRLWLTSVDPRPPETTLPPLPPETLKSAEPTTSPAAAQTLGVLRDFSAILTQSLNSEGMRVSTSAGASDAAVNWSSAICHSPWAPKSIRSLRLGRRYPALNTSPRIRPARFITLTSSLSSANKPGCRVRRC